MNQQDSQNFRRSTYGLQLVSFGAVQLNLIRLRSMDQHVHLKFSGSLPTAGRILSLW
jgi:hypothetical protein